MEYKLNKNGTSSVEVDFMLQQARIEQLKQVMYYKGLQAATNAWELPKVAEPKFKKFNYEGFENTVYYKGTGKTNLITGDAYGYVKNGSGAPITTQKSPIIVTEEMINAAMKDAPLKTQQGAVSLPAIQRYVTKLENGEVAPPIKVDNGIIVDGNHRYVAGRIFGQEPSQIQWSG